MSLFPLNLDQETAAQGMYLFEGTCYGAPYAEVEHYHTPITPRENWHSYVSGGKYAWIPDVSSDVVDITPDCIPDVIACGFQGGFDTFGVKWIPVENNDELPAFVEPGFVVLEDIADWKTLPWPDVDSWPWKEYGEKYQQTLAGDDRVHRGVILSGFFERLISIMTFEGAAVALLEDPEVVDAFFSALADMNIKIVEHYKKDFGCDAIMLHDDWSAQRSPFFSLNTVNELIVPHLKRVVDYCHDLDMQFTLHSCGNGVLLIPAMKAAGIDAWQAQLEAIGDVDAVLEKIDGAFMLETYPVIENISGEEKRAFIHATMENTVRKNRWLPVFFDMNFEDPNSAVETRQMAYEEGRKVAETLGFGCV